MDLSFLDTWPLERLEALYRVAKTRGRAFFADPRAMVELRERVDDARAARHLLRQHPAFRTPVKIRKAA